MGKAVNLARIVDGSGGIGYQAGQGGAVTQATNKSTAVTLDKLAGRITMHNAALGAGASVTFTLNNSLIDADDLIVVQQAGWASYRVEAWANNAGSAVVRVTNVSGGSLSEAVVLNFAILKSAIT